MNKIHGLHNPELQDCYEALFTSSIKAIENNRVQTDRLIDSDRDDRRGFSLVLRPGKTVTDRIQLFQNALKDLEPDQYYYPHTDLHHTVLAILTCGTGSPFQRIDPAGYIDLIRQSLAGCEPFSLAVSGITGSSSCVMVRGFPENGTLEAMRNNLRRHFKASSLHQTIDQRYVLSTAHSTIMRFRSALRDPKRFAAFLRKHREHSFGSFAVEDIDFVLNDWYMRDSKVRMICRFQLGCL